MSTIAEVAAHLDLGERRVYELQSRDIIPKAERGQTDLDVARIAYIRHLRDGASGRTPQGDLDPAQERARKDRALAISSEIKNDLAMGNVVPVDVAIAGVNVQLRKLRNKLLGLPSRIASRVPAQVKAETFALAEAEVHAMMGEMSAGGDMHVRLEEIEAEAERSHD